MKLKLKAVGMQTFEKETIYVGFKAAIASTLSDNQLMKWLGGLQSKRKVKVPLGVFNPIYAKTQEFTVIPEYETVEVEEESFRTFLDKLKGSLCERFEKSPSFMLKDSQTKNVYVFSLETVEARVGLHRVRMNIVDLDMYDVKSVSNVPDIDIVSLDKKKFFAADEALPVIIEPLVRVWSNGQNIELPKAFEGRLKHQIGYELLSLGALKGKAQILLRTDIKAILEYCTLNHTYVKDVSYSKFREIIVAFGNKSMVWKNGFVDISELEEVSLFKEEPEERVKRNVDFSSLFVEDDTKSSFEGEAEDFIKSLGIDIIDEEETETD